MTVARTQDEILARIKEIGGEDAFGFESNDLMLFLDHEHVRPFLKDEFKDDEWTAETDPIAEIKEYMEFALDKAVSHRGLSASRSISHMRAYLWLAGDDDLVKFADGNFSRYGAPILKRICAEYSIDYKELFTFPNNLEKFEKMAQGKSCRPDCDEGC